MYPGNASPITIARKKKKKKKKIVCDLMGVGHMDGWDIGIELSIVRGGGRGEIKVMNSATLSALCIRMLNMVGCLKKGSLWCREILTMVCRKE